MQISRLSWPLIPSLPGCDLNRWAGSHLEGDFEQVSLAIHVHMYSVPDPL